MALAHSPRTVTDGLVFYMDQGNTYKSWKGKPTTNFLTNGHFSGGNKIAQESGSNPTNEIIVLRNPGSSEYVLRQTGTVGYTEYQLNLTTQLAANTTYVMSGWYAESSNYSCADGSRMFHSRAYSTSGAHVSLGIGIGTILETKVVDGITWKYCYATITTPADYSNVFEWYVGYGGSAYTGHRYYTDLQVEVGTFPSRFVNGTRSNTQALLDLTGKNTITVVGTPTFNTDRLTIPNTNSSYLDVSPSTNFKMGTQDFTISAWVKQLDNSANTITEARDGSTLQGYFFCLNYPSAGQIGFFVNPSTGQAVYSTSVATLGYNVVQNITAVVKRSNATIELYVNGSLYDTITGIQTASISGTGDMYRIGYDRGGATTNMDIYAYSHYNKALSLQEVQQNFNALRGRYGI